LISSKNNGKVYLKRTKWSGNLNHYILIVNGSK
jgi:hypothetical protein